MERYRLYMQMDDIQLSAMADAIRNGEDLDTVSHTLIHPGYRLPRETEADYFARMETGADQFVYANATS